MEELKEALKTADFKVTQNPFGFAFHFCDAENTASYEGQLRTVIPIVTGLPPSSSITRGYLIFNFEHSAITIDQETESAIITGMEEALGIDFPEERINLEGDWNAGPERLLKIHGECDPLIAVAPIQKSDNLFKPA